MVSFHQTRRKYGSIHGSRARFKALIAVFGVGRGREWMLDDGIQRPVSKNCNESLPVKHADVSRTCRESEDAADLSRNI